MTGLFLVAAAHLMTYPLDHGLVVSDVVLGGASAAISIDAVQAALASNRWTTPTEGQRLPGSDRTWHAAPAPDKDGFLEGPTLRRGYYWAQFDSPKDQVLLLSCPGAAMAYVNGQAVIGDLYGYNTVTKPVLLHRGKNEFLFGGIREGVRAELTEPSQPVLLGHDLTLPDVRLEAPKKSGLAGLQVINATQRAVRFTSVALGDDERRIDVEIAPLSIRKIGIEIPLPPVDANYESLTYALRGAGAELKFPLALRLRKPGETYKVTFRSEIDGSVQYYAVRPALRPSKKNAFILSLHGASVEASGQSEAYGPKNWATIVCPTNRRPYGFDWEDWGRMDALEVLAHAKREIPHDPARTVLTGHSMGGHGTWQLGTMYPDKFAAIGPSAGWISYQSYRIRIYGEHVLQSQTEAQKRIQEASLGSDTVARVRNLAPLGVYVLHGVDDDNVPVTEARSMRDALTPFHHDFSYWEQKGANHWWSVQEEPGASCVDWPPMMDMFARRRIPAADEIRDIDFVSVAPNLSADCYWARIEQQSAPFRMSSLKLHVDPNLHRITGTTDNVATLTLRGREVFPDGRPFKLVLDGDAIDAPNGDAPLTLRRSGRWSVSNPVPPVEKNPNRGGGFKEALAHRFAIVYGTKGSAEENAAMEALAHFDAESWWYRGNGDVEVLPDRSYRKDRMKGRDVLLIGNSDTNAAYDALLADSPIQVSRTGVKVGSATYPGGDKAVLFCRPAGSSMVACVGVTGLASMRVVERIPYLASGIGYPDFTVFDADCLKTGTKGILSAGWFDNAWRL